MGTQKRIQRHKQGESQGLTSSAPQHTQEPSQVSAPQPVPMQETGEQEQQVPVARSTSSNLLSHCTIMPPGSPPPPPSQKHVAIQPQMLNFAGGHSVPLQRQPDLGAQITAQLGKGMPLPATVRTHLEGGMGSNLHTVQQHPGHLDGTPHSGGVFAGNPAARSERAASDTAATGSDGLAAQGAHLKRGAGVEGALPIQRMPSPLLRQDRVGKWAATSGMLAAGLASDKMRQVAKDEQAITMVISKTVAQQGGKMYGLENRLKTEDSLARKIHDTAPEEGLDEEAYAARVKDAVRYTAHFPEAKYTASVNNTMAALKSSGYEPHASMKNTWRPESTYRGLNTWWKTPGGTIFELQFHTPESQRVKDINHKKYDEERLPATPADRKQQLKQEMQENAIGIPLPGGAIQIGMPSPLLRQDRVGRRP